MGLSGLQRDETLQSAMHGDHDARNYLQCQLCYRKLLMGIRDFSVMVGQFAVNCAVVVVMLVALDWLFCPYISGIAGAAAFGCGSLFLFLFAKNPDVLVGGEFTILDIQSVAYVPVISQTIGFALMCRAIDRACPELFTGDPGLWAWLWYGTTNIVKTITFDIFDSYNVRLTAIQHRGFWVSTIVFVHRLSLTLAAVRLALEAYGILVRHRVAN